MGGSPRWERALIAGIVLSSLLLQLLVLPSSFSGPDSANFLRMVSALQTPGFWSDPAAFDGNYWSVGYSTMLAIMMEVASGEVALVLGLQACLSSGLSLIAYSLAHRLGPVKRVAAAALVAFSPTTWWMARNGGYELALSLALCASVMVLWGAGTAPLGPRWWRAGGAAVTAGLLFGLAVLIQSKVVLLAGILGWLAWRWGGRSLTGFLVSTALVLAPWSVRNSIVLGNPSPLNSNGPVNFWIGNNPAATTGGFMEPPPTPAGADFVSAGLQFLLSQPEASFALALRRAARLLEPTFVYPESLASTPAMLFIHWWAILLSSFGALGVAAFAIGRLWLGRDRMPPVGALTGFCLLFYALHLPFLAEPRFMAPIIPVVIVVAVATWPALVSRAFSGHLATDSPRVSACHDC